MGIAAALGSAGVIPPELALWTSELFIGGMDEPSDGFADDPSDEGRVDDPSDGGVVDDLVTGVLAPDDPLKDAISDPLAGDGDPEDDLGDDAGSFPNLMIALRDPEDAWVSEAVGIPEAVGVPETAVLPEDAGVPD